MDQQAMQVYLDKGHQEAVKMVTAYSIDAGDKMHQDWVNFFGYLFARFRDFIVMERDDTNLECACKPSKTGTPLPPSSAYFCFFSKSTQQYFLPFLRSVLIAFPGIDEAWKSRIVAERGDHYLAPDATALQS